MICFLVISIYAALGRFFIFSNATPKIKTLENDLLQLSGLARSTFYYYLNALDKDKYECKNKKYKKSTIQIRADTDTEELQSPMEYHEKMMLAA